MEVGSIFVFKKGFRVGEFGCMFRLIQYNSHVSLEDWDWLIYTYKQFYLLYFFCLWPVWPLNLWLHFLNWCFYSFKCSCIVEKTSTVLIMFMVYIYPLCVYISVLHVVSWFSVCISFLIIYLLVDELSNQKFQKNQFHFAFCFEIVLACSFRSLGTISSTNIFGAISGDGSEVYLPQDIIIDLVLRGEQNQKFFQTTFFTKQWLP